MKTKDEQFEDGELTPFTIKMLMAYFDKRTEGRTLVADVSFI